MNFYTKTVRSKIHSSTSDLLISMLGNMCFHKRGYTNRQKKKKGRERERETETERERQTDRQTNGQADRQTETEREAGA